jgi:hypothetical protein
MTDMGKAYKPKHLVLQQFTKLLYQHDPMGLAAMGAPDNEYESEALSILCRFNESALALCADKEAQVAIAEGTVKQAFAFWFNAASIEAPEVLSATLLKAYLASYPPREQIVPSEVPSRA